MGSIRWFRRTIFVVLAVAGFAGTAQADYPDHTINGIIAWGPGGGTDAVSRLTTPAAEKILGQSITLVNKTGNTGAIATQAVHAAPADGYTLLLHSENPLLYQMLGLSPLSYDDFEPVVISAHGSTVIVVPKDSPFKTYADLVKAAKATPGKISFGVSGTGSLSWVAARLLRKIERITFSQPSLEGDGALVTALLGQRFDVSSLAVGTAAPHIKNGSLRALAILKNSPNPALPDIPYITQLNPDFTSAVRASGFFYGVFVKKGTPAPIVEKLVAAYKTALGDTKFVNYANASGLDVIGLTGQHARDFMNAWRSHMAWMIDESGPSRNSPEKPAGDGK